MRYVLAFASVFAPILVSTSARAATGLVCDGVDVDARVSVLLGSGLIRTPLAATLRDARGERHTAGPGQAPATALVIGQSWLDATEFRLDLLDADARDYEARLRVRFLKTGPTLATGTLVLGRGRVVEVECQEG